MCFRLPASALPLMRFCMTPHESHGWDGFPGDFAEGLCGTSQKDIELLRFRDALDAGKKRWDCLRNPKHDTVGKVMPRPKPMS